MHILFFRPQLVAVEKEVLVTLQFPDVDALNPPILVLNEIDFKYNEQKVIFHQMNLNANLQSRICIVSSFAPKLCLPNFLIIFFCLFKGGRKWSW